MQNSIWKKIPWGWVSLILLFALFLRIYNLSRTLHFFGDQGEHAINAWKIWHEGDLPLLGTATSASERIVVGPLYYYLTAPFYALSGGDPILPAIFLSILSVFSTFALYFLVYRIFGKKVAILTLILTTFSFNVTVFSRWFNNPNPAFLISVGLIFALFEIMQTRRRLWWVIASFLVGLSFHFEAASGFFYIVFLTVFCFWQRGKGLNLKTIFLMFTSFTATFTPLIIYDFGNKYILSRELFSYIFLKGNFGHINIQSILEKLYFIKVFFVEFTFPHNEGLAYILIFVLVNFIVFDLKKDLKKDSFKLILFFLATPFVSIFFLKERIVNYYLSGFYSLFFVFIAYVLASFWDQKKKLFVVVIIVFFVVFNLKPTFNYLKSGNEENRVSQINDQKAVVDWIASKEAGNNIDLRAFVPDKFSDEGFDYDYPYKYLLMLKNIKTHDFREPCLPKTNAKVVYMILEKDIVGDERLKEWYSCNNLEKIKILDSGQFGGITVQKIEI